MLYSASAFVIFHLGVAASTYQNKTTVLDRKRGTEMEHPECPVCLQPYSSTNTTIPRVLPCGHSACELCLSLLPSRSPHPNSIRCPSCNQLVRVSNPSIGSKSFPKNIDLIRICSSLPEPDPKPKPDSALPEPDYDFGFVGCKWRSDEDFVLDWKKWILPRESISVANFTEEDDGLVLGIHTVPCFRDRRRVQDVSLFPIIAPSNETNRFKLSYVARIMESIWQLEENAKDQLHFLLEACLGQKSGICKVLGFWINADVESSPLYLVCEKFDRTLADLLRLEQRSRLGLETEEKFGFRMVASELCEIIMSFYAEGVCFGYLSTDCFSLNVYGHCLLDLNKLLIKVKRLHENFENENLEYLSPDTFIAMKDGNLTVNHKSDVWSIGYILAMILIGDEEISAELFKNVYCPFIKCDSNNFSDDHLNRYDLWRGKVVSMLEAKLLKTKFEFLIEMLSSCLIHCSKSRPQAKDIWFCIWVCYTESCDDNDVNLEKYQKINPQENLLSCLYIGNIGNTFKEDVGMSQNHFANNKFDVLRCHHDCISGLAVGGGYLFSSSFDKTVSVWSLQDNSHIQTLKGHDHKVMAVAVVEETPPLCISGDSASGICVWRIGASIEQELMKKWYEHNDWRYSGIHSLAVSGEFLYTGSGDKSIKAWSLQDYSLACTMTGHNSTVSCLVVANGILYSGSWDGTVRLWFLSDHSALSVLEDDATSTGLFVPVLSLSVHQKFVVSSYENGNIKIWKNGTFVKSKRVQDGAVFALHMDMNLIFTGGWNKSISIQESSEDELEIMLTRIASINCDSTVTSLVSWHGTIYVGLSNKEIRAYRT